MYFFTHYESRFAGSRVPTSMWSARSIQRWYLRQFSVFVDPVDPAWTPIKNAWTRHSDVTSLSTRNIRAHRRRPGIKKNLLTRH